MRLLGVDFGAARTGLALSDPHAITCSPLEVVDERDEARVVQRISAVVAEHGVGEVVVGLPRPLRGGTNPQLAAAEGFARRLAQSLSIPVATWDERFTSKLADRQPPPPRSGRRLSRAAARPGPREPRDAVAACHLLQNYLDARSFRGTTGGQ